MLPRLVVNFLSSGNPPALASQSASITGMSHRPANKVSLFEYTNLFEECKIKIDLQLCILNLAGLVTSVLAHFFFFLFPHRLIELHSPDSRNTLILRCKDTATAHSWFVAIHTNIMALLPQVLAELNAMLGATSTAGGSKEVKHIAWLAEQVGWEAGQSITWFPFSARMVPHLIYL